MKFLPTIIFSFFVSICFISCQKNIDQFIPDPIQAMADTAWQNNIASNASVISLQNDLRQPFISDSFSYSNTGLVFSSGNLSLTVPANGLVKNNGAVPAGVIKRETILLQKKGDFIAMNMPTTFDGKLLVTGGAFFLSLKNNAVPLSVSTGNKLTVKFNNPFPLANNVLFNAVTDSITGAFIRWEQNLDTAFNKSLSSLAGYEIQTNKLNFVQTAHVLDTTGIQQTNVSLKLPSNYTNGNTVAYISFNNIETVTGFTANINTRKFVSASLPVGKPITVTVISKQAGDYYLGTLQTVTTLSPSGTALQELNMVPIKKSLVFIKNYLNNL